MNRDTETDGFLCTGNVYVDSQPTPASSSFSNIPKLLDERSLLMLCIVLGAAEIWINRYLMNEDGVSYLDVGDAFFHHDWARAINGYWSPMYTWFLGLAINLTKPSIWWEPITAHIVNFLIYLFALFSFRFFLHCVYRPDNNRTPESASPFVPLPKWMFYGLGYCIFLWASLELIDLSYITPDLLVEAFVFLICGYLVQLGSEESYWKFAMFGVLGGAGYLSKAVMFPVGFVFLVILMFSARLSKRRILGVLLAGFMFVLVSAPFIAALSKQKGRLTFGDSGKLNYAFLVSPEIPHSHWQGDIPGGGTPKHTTRQLLDDPPVFEFGQPIGGTFPPWFDPSYWCEGAKPTFRLRAQIRVLIQSARNYSAMLTSQLGLLAGLLVFVLLGGRPTRRAILAKSPLIAAGLFPVFLYSIVLVRSRYTAGALVLLVIATLGGVRLRRDDETDKFSGLVTLAVMATILLSVAAYLAETAYLTNTVYANPTQKDYLRAAEGLKNMALRTGDPVAVIGSGAIEYWARLDRLRIVAEVYAPGTSNPEFWGATPERRALAYQCLRRSGAKAVVAWSPPSGKEAAWARVGATNYYVYFLR
jgi:hypothetical protein